MKPVTQTTFGDKRGNCYAACIASLLEIPLDGVPNFCFEAKSESRWMNEVQDWLKEQGWGIAMMLFPKLDSIKETIYVGMFPKDCHYIISGKSPRGLLHSVIGRDGKIVHDPHPDGGGVTLDDEITVEVIVKL